VYSIYPRNTWQLRREHRRVDNQACNVSRVTEIFWDIKCWDLEIWINNMTDPNIQVDKEKYEDKKWHDIYIRNMSTQGSSNHSIRGTSQ
jgi:hypothetical protein